MDTMNATKWTPQTTTMADGSVEATADGVELLVKPMTTEDGAWFWRARIAGRVAVEAWGFHVASADQARADALAAVATVRAASATLNGAK